MLSSEQIAEILLDVRAVTLSPNEPYTYASGIKSPIYCDNRLLMSYPKEREQLVDAFIAILKDMEFDVLAGTATAGIPWAAWLAQRLGKPMVFVRKEHKGHGKQNQIEGKIQKGKRAVVIEDLVSTGGSALAAVEALRDAGAEVVHCVAIFTYEMKSAKENFEKAGCELRALSNFSTLVSVAAKSGYIGGQDKDMVLAWSKNPQEWGVNQ